jgi:hypothetical protein
MDKNVLAAGFRGDETKALVIIEPLNGSFDTVTHSGKLLFLYRYNQQLTVQDEVAPNKEVKKKPPDCEVQAADLH